MAYEIPERWPLGQIRAYVNERAATFVALASLPLEALAQLPAAEHAEEMRRAEKWKAIAEQWTTFEQSVDEERTRTDAAEREARVKRGRVRAVDVRWEGALSQLGVTVQVASGNNPRSAPYNQLFGTVTIQDARGFGARNASLWGQATAKKAVTLDVRFGPDAKRLEVYSNLYGAVGDDRDLLAVVEAEAQARKARLHLQLEDLVSATEQAIYEFLPRVEAKSAVRALLAPTSSRPGKNRKAEDTDEADVIEETDAA